MKKEYTSPLCELFELSAEASMCVAASIEAFSNTDEDIDLFNILY